MNEFRESLTRGSILIEELSLVSCKNEEMKNFTVKLESDMYIQDIDATAVSNFKWQWNGIIILEPSNNRCFSMSKPFQHGQNWMHKVITRPAPSLERIVVERSLLKMTCKGQRTYSELYSRGIIGLDMNRVDCLNIHFTEPLIGEKIYEFTLIGYGLHENEYVKMQETHEFICIPKVYNCGILPRSTILKDRKLLFDSGGNNI